MSMELRVNCESAREALETVVRITGAQHANLEIRKKDVFISAAGNNRAIRVLIKSDITSEGKSKIKGFGFNTFTLQKLLTGRAEIDFTIDDNEIGFKSAAKGSKFAGKFHPVPFEEIKITEDDTKQEIAIKGSVMAALLEAVKKVSLSNLFTTDPMTLFVRFDKSGLKTTVFDSYHMAFSHNSAMVSDDTIDFSVTLPLFETVASVAKGQDYTLSVGNVYVTAKALGFEFSLPTLQSVEGQSFDMAEEFISALNFGKTHRMEIDVNDLVMTLDSLGAVSDQNSGVVIEEDKGNAKFSLKSGFGQASERRKVPLTGWKDNKYTLSVNLFRDVLGQYPSDRVTLHFQNELVIFYDETGPSRTTYTCLLQ